MAWFHSQVPVPSVEMWFKDLFGAYIESRKPGNMGGGITVTF